MTNAAPSRAKFGLSTAAALASLSIRGKAAIGAQFAWKWGTNFGAEHPVCVRAVEAFAKVRNETKGQLDVKAFPNSILGNEMVNELRVGALEMTTETGGQLDTFVPGAAIENLAFAFPTREAAFAAMDGDLGALIRQRLADKGVFALERIWDLGFRDIFNSKRPIRTVDDLEGLKIRVTPGKIRIDTFEALGAAPTPVAPGEVYSALQTRVVDGCETALGLAESLRWFEVQKYCSLTHHQWSGHWNLINMEKWASLPAEFQQILRARLNQAVLLERRDNEVGDRAMQDLLHRQGLTFNKPAPTSFKAKLVSSGYYTRWRKEFGEVVWNLMEKYTGRFSRLHEAEMA